jgi:hypothetical protein
MTATRTWLLLLSALLALGLALGCCEKDEEEDDDDGATDADTDADSDGDSDSDTDSDTDADTDSDTDGCTPATVEEVCDTIFDICVDHWGWPSIEDCYADFIGNEGMGTDCADEDGYFGCVCDCTPLSDCDGFGACEHPCWDANCP